MHASRISALLDRVASVKENIAIAAGDPRVLGVASRVWSQGRTFGLDLPLSRLRDIAALGATLRSNVYDGEPEAANEWTDANGGLGERAA